MNLRILLTGSLGMLAGDLVPQLIARGATLELTDHRDGLAGGKRIQSLDICDAARVNEVVRATHPAWIVNCAAYTAVDKAEAEKETAFAVNAKGPENLARAAAEVGACLLHISTDYVFGGGAKQSNPYLETDAFDPCGVYGESKCAGDKIVAEILPAAHLIVRPSWLHGTHGPNFLETILKAAREKPELRVVNDQVGSPTYAAWLAQTICELIEKNARGTFHATSRGNISWFDFAAEIIAQAGFSTRLLPQTTQELNRAAPRPYFSTLDLGKLEGYLARPCPSWKVGVREHLQALSEKR